ncbi:MAG: thioredoxin-dependent thiol peroxidase [Planctomycetota bacterium]|nr:thioredoxin-dependent thiol peroxidase [Planctomycetota bacterium]
MIDVGSPAPDFALTDQHGNTARLADLLARGAGAVLFFYPKAMTPGCTQESCDFEARAAAFAGEGVAVVGISPDSPERQAKFADKEGLGSLLLLSDPDHRVAAAYGAWGKKSLYGREFQGVLRSTFLIGKDGKVQRAWRSVKVNGHADAVLAAAGGEAAPAAKKKAPAAKKKAPAAKKKAPVAKKKAPATKKKAKAGARR